MTLPRTKTALVALAFLTLGASSALADEKCEKAGDAIAAHLKLTITQRSGVSTTYPPAASYRFRLDCMSFSSLIFETDKNPPDAATLDAFGSTGAVVFKKAKAADLVAQAKECLVKAAETPDKYTQIQKNFDISCLIMNGKPSLTLMGSL